MKNIKLIDKYDVNHIAQEVERNTDLWDENTERQKYLLHHKHTKSIFLYRAWSEDPLTNQIDKKTVPTTYVSRYPETKALLDELAAHLNGKLGRVMLALLPSHREVDTHIDKGEYYKYHNRYHLGILGGFSDLISGDDICKLQPGDLLWINNKIMHSARNHCDIDRVNLIFDLLPNHSEI